VQMFAVCGMLTRLVLTFMYVLNCPAPKRFDLNPTEQDSNRVISFSKGRTDLASCHLAVNGVQERLRPPELLTDHLSQGVYTWCLYPEFESASHQDACGLSFVTEGLETPLSPEDDDVDNLTGHISARLSFRSDSRGWPVSGEEGSSC